MPSFKVRPKTVSMHGRQVAIYPPTGQTMFSMAKVSRIKTLSLRHNLEVCIGDNSDEVCTPVPVYRHAMAQPSQCRLQLVRCIHIMHHTHIHAHAHLALQCSSAQHCPLDSCPVRLPAAATATAPGTSAQLWGCQEFLRGPGQMVQVALLCIRLPVRRFIVTHVPSRGVMQLQSYISPATAGPLAAALACMPSVVQTRLRGRS